MPAVLPPPPSGPPSLFASTVPYVPTVKDQARDLDLEYARLVCGAAHARNLSTVWGPRDGVSVSMVDSRRLQEVLFNFISQRMLAELNAHPGQIQGGSGLPPARDMELMGFIARGAREDFNRGWNSENDVGILNETLAAEIQVLPPHAHYFLIPEESKLTPANNRLCRCCGGTA